MSAKFRIAYFAHSVRSDWNNGNAHFLRGLLRCLTKLGHDVTVFEPDNGWSIANLAGEAGGRSSLLQFAQIYPELSVTAYDLAGPDDRQLGSVLLSDTDFVIVHEWNMPELVHQLLALRRVRGFRLLFHDTHHRASSSPEVIRLLRIDQFDGVIAFGEALRLIYREHFNLNHVWTLHEAADTSVFYPRNNSVTSIDVVWVGNWGDNERSAEIKEFLLQPAARLPQYHFCIYGVRYPDEGLAALKAAGVSYRGYLANLDAPEVYASSRLTVHVPRQQYSGAMAGIPTIRVFEALASGIPLLSAPWVDCEQLFRRNDFCLVSSGAEMQAAMDTLLTDAKAAGEQAHRGLQTVLARHTCRHRAEQLTSILEEVLR